jgi:hypothetical protein
MINGEEFCRVAKEVRESLYEGKLSADLNITQDYLWFQAMRRLIKEYEIRNDLSEFIESIDLSQVLPKQFKGIAGVVKEMNKIFGKICTDVALDSLIKEHMRDDSCVEIDNSWKDKSTTYIFHIRQIVSKATIEEGLRERIFSRLNDLQSEIDRNRTHLRSITEVFLTLTEAVSKGAKHLDGAVKLIERLGGAFSGARSAKIEHEAQLKLPKPEQLGLSDLPPSDII